LCTHNITCKNLQSEERTCAILGFFSAVQTFYTCNQRPQHVDSPATSALTILTNEIAHQMTSRQFQELLRANHIVITNAHLIEIPCNRRGLTMLNGLKEIVSMEGIVIYIYAQTFSNQF
jgi:hypothetical protein